MENVTVTTDNRIELYNDGIGCVEIVDHMGTDMSVVNAARVSLGKHKEVMDDGDEKLIKYLLKNKHTSPFEHCVVTFRFVVPLFVRAQHQRHRVWSFMSVNEMSRRYTSENIQFYSPQNLFKQAKINRQASDEVEVVDDEVDLLENMRAHRIYSENFYKELLINGVAREIARCVLPSSLYTEYYGTVNLHNIFHFMNLRLDSHSQFEIRRVASAMSDLVAKLYPKSVQAYSEVFPVK